jgi:hypothetical protein
MPILSSNCSGKAVLILVATFAFAVPAFSQTSDRAAERAYIQKAEADWAEAVASNDCSVAERILADEFIGVEVDGTQYTRADSLQSCRTRESNFEFCHAQGIDVRFYGDTAIARGSEKWKLKSGKSGVFVWTDTWIKRGGKWQVVAAEDLIPSPSPFANAEPLRNFVIPSEAEEPLLRPCTPWSATSVGVVGPRPAGRGMTNPLPTAVTAAASGYGASAAWVRRLASAGCRSPARAR